MAKRIVIGQKVTYAKVERAKQLRREMTDEERILWRELRTNMLEDYHFRRQQIIAGFIVDFYCHAASLVIEIDGGIHQNQQEYDAERDHVLTARGLRILRVTNQEVQHNLDGVLARIASACRSSAPPFPRREGAGG